jgi:branched-chain amino acid transport system substrate-binding protein
MRGLVQVRRLIPRLVAGAALIAATAPAAMPVAAQEYPSSIVIGINLPFTGADAADAVNLRDGALMAIDEINNRGGIAGRIMIQPLVKDDGTVAAGQYDPAQAATNTKQFVADPSVVAIVGPQMSGSGKAMAPIASEANLMIITPASTNPDITDPNFASQYRPGGRAIYFRTVTTDAYQGPYMANYAAGVLGVHSVYVLDDTGAYGEGVANSFEQRARELGLEVLGRDKLNPRESDYTTILTKIKAMNPGALYYGGVQQAAVKLAVQANEIMPDVPKLGGDGVYSVSFPNDAGRAAENWYATIAAPYSIGEPQAQEWVEAYTAKFGQKPQAYALTAYNAVLVLEDAVARIVNDGVEINRDNVRDYAQTTVLPTLQGTISFDENGDLAEKVISVFQVKDGQYQYVGTAPTS